MEAILNYILHQLKIFALKSCKNKLDAEDLVQDTCERMILAYERYAGLPLNELQRIATVTMKRILIDNYRKKLTRPALTNELPFYLAGSEDVERDYEYKHIMDIIRSSPDQHIKVFYLSIQGYKMREISKMNNIPLGTATGNSRYGRKKLIKNFLISS